MPGAANELVLSNEEIQAELGSPDTDVSEEQVDQVSESDEDFSNWEDQTDDDAQSVGEDGETAPVEAQVRQIKANGKMHEVDMNDQEGVDRLLALGLGARQLFSKADKLEKENASLKKKVESGSKYERMWKKMDSLKSDHDALYEAIYGRKYEDAYKERRDWDNRFEAASPEQQQVMLEQKSTADERRRLERERQEWENSKQETDSKVEAAERKELRAQMLPEFYKYEFSSKIDDSVQAEKLNAVLWKTAVSNLKAYGDDVEITPELIRKEFRETAELLGGSAKKTAEKEVKKVIEQKKQTSKEQAKVAASRNYGANSPDRDLAKEKDPVKLMRLMFKRK
jgi:hypothetical protein